MWSQFILIPYLLLLPGLVLNNQGSKKCANHFFILVYFSNILFHSNNSFSTDSYLLDTGKKRFKRKKIKGFIWSILIQKGSKTSRQSGQSNVQKYLHDILQFSVLILFPSLAGYIIIIVSILLYSLKSISIFIFWHCKSRTISKLILIWQNTTKINLNGADDL